MILLSGQQGQRAAAVWPWAIISLSVLCVWAGLLFYWLEPNQREAMIAALGASPARVYAAFEGGQWFGLSAMAPMTSVFVHASVLHLLGNLAYLWVFGWPLERRLGPWLLMLVFVGGGVMAHTVLALQLPAVEIPVIGASGAVSAVVGAYLGLFPNRKIGLYLPLGLVMEFVRVPSLLVIGSWFGLQLVYASPGPITGVMAWWTHLAGFTFGLMFSLLVRALSAVRPDRQPMD